MGSGTKRRIVGQASHVSVTSGADVEWSLLPYILSKINDEDSPAVPDRSRPPAHSPADPGRRRFLIGSVSGLALMGSPLAALADSPPAAPVIGRDVTSFVLGNGLQVVVIPDRRAPVVTHMVWYKIGAADEPRLKSGIAHYLEHLMFKGTPTNPNGAFSKKVSQIGGQENAFTSSDYTAYFQRVSKEQLGLVMSLEADRMGNLVLSEATAKPELQVVLEERSMRTDSDPGALLGEAVDAALYVNHPYRIPVIGWRHEIETLTYKDAITFYDQHYTPNNAILIVAGDVDPASVRGLAEATYGKVARRAEAPERVRPQEPEPNSLRQVTYQDERVSQSSFRRAFLVPSERTAKPGESEALEVLAEILGPSTTSRMYRSLVLEQELATSAGGWYQSASWDDTKFMLYATPRDGVTLEQVRAAIDKIVTALATDGPTAEEVARAKHKVVADAVHAQDSQSSLARIFGASLATGSTVERIQTWPSRIYAVEPAAVKAVAQKFLTPERSVIGYLVNGPNAVAKRTAATAARTPFPAGPIRHHDDASVTLGRIVP